jgi:hypothetical protein
MSTSTPSSSADADSPETPESSRPIDHARMVLTPILLVGGIGYLFFGPGTLPENTALTSILVLFGVLNGEKFYRTWIAAS